MSSQLGGTGQSDADDLLTIDEVTVGGRTVIAARGEIDRVTSHRLREAVSRARESGAIELWIDLEGVQFMDAAGLRAVLEARHDFHDSPRRFALICPPGPARRVFEIAGVERSLAIFDDRAAAQAAP